MNGMTTPNASQPAKKCTSYKLLTDPAIKKGCQKLYRYDGVVSGHMGQQLSVKFVNDPRSRLSRLWRNTEVADLPIPKMKFDKYYVGELPPKQITFTNLNDNVREPFLRNMVEKHGKVEDITIYRHPKTSKHLGLASATYTSTRSARQAAAELNRTSVMGKIIIVQIDPGGKECQRIFDCLVSNKPNTPSSIGSTPRDPRNGTPSSTIETPKAHNDPRRLSLDRSNSVAQDTPSSSVSSATPTPGYLPAESHAAFPAYPEQSTPQFQGVADPNASQFQMPDQTVQPEMLAHSMNSVTLQQYQNMQSMYAGQQGPYPVQTPDAVSHTPIPDMYGQQQPVPMSEGFAMPQTPTAQAVPNQQSIYSHQQLPVTGQNFMGAQNVPKASQVYQAQSVRAEAHAQQDQQYQSHVDPQTYPAHSKAYETGTEKPQQFQSHGQQHQAQQSKKETFSRGESYNSRDDGQDSYQSRSYQSHSGKSHRHSTPSSSSKRFDDDRGKGRHDYDSDRSKKWDKKDRQDYHSDKRYERRRYKSQDYSDEEDGQDSGGYHRRDYRQSHGSSHYRSKDSDRGSKHRYNDSYHHRSRRGYDDDDDKDQDRSRYGSKSKGYDRKADSRTHRDDFQDKRKSKKWDTRESIDLFEKWRCPTGTEETLAKEKEEPYKFDVWKCPTGEITPSEPVAKPEKFEKWRPPTADDASAFSPIEQSSLQEWQCAPGEEPPPGTMPLVLPSEPRPPGTQDDSDQEDEKEAGSQGDPDDLDQSLDTRIEKLLQSSQGPMAFAGFNLEDSGNAGKNSSTTVKPIQPPGTEEAAFSQSEESVRTSEAEDSANCVRVDDQWNQPRRDQYGGMDQMDNQWSSPQVVHHPPGMDSVPHPRLDALKGGLNGSEPYHTPQSSTPPPPGRQSGSATPSLERKVSQGVEILISKQLANLRNYDQQIASRGTSPVSDLVRDRSQTSTPGIEDRYSLQQGSSVHATPMDTGADDMDDDDDDKMSLSSLSSGDDTKIVVNAPVPQKKPLSPRGNSMPYSMPGTSWNSSMNRSSTNVVNTWAAQMMPQTVTGNTQQQLASQPSTSTGYRSNPMFPPGPPPSFPGMPPSGMSLSPQAMEAFFTRMPFPSSPSTSHSNLSNNAHMMHMMSSMGGIPHPPLGPDGLPDLKAMERLLNTPPRCNFPNSPGYPSGSPAKLSNPNLPPWASMPFMPPFQDTMVPSPERPQRDPEKELVNEVLNTVIQEMQLIMKKDLNRKMVESKAFKSLEAWWDTCQLMAKAKEEMKPKEEEKTPKKPPPAIPSIHDSSWSSSFSMEGLGLGLGLRANMPRMPSFKVKRKPPSPLPEDEKGDDEAESEDEKRPETPPVLDEDSDEMSDMEQDETEISSQTSEQQILARREQARKAREFIYTSSSEDEDDEKEETLAKEEEEEDEEEEEEEEEDEEDDEEEEEEDDEEDEEEEEEEELEEDVDELKEEASKSLAKALQVDIIPVKEEPTKVEDRKAEKTKKKARQETIKKDEVKSSQSSDEEDEADEDWSATEESSSSSETESSSSDMESSESDDDQEDDEGKSADDKKEDRLGAFEILVEMATKAKDKIDQSSSDTEGKKGLKSDMELSDIQAAQSLQALRMHSSGDGSDVGEMTALKGDTSDMGPEKTLSGSDVEPEVVDVGDYKNILQKQPVVVLEPMAIMDHTYAQKPLQSPVQEKPETEEVKRMREEAVLAEKTNKLAPTAAAIKAQEKEERQRQKKEEKEREKEKKKEEKEKKKIARKRKNELAQILEEEVVIVPEPRVPEFKPRNYYEEWTYLYEFLRTGIDHEDAYLVRKSYETLLEAGRIPWLSYTHWVPHALTCSPDPPQPKKRKTEEESREHFSGSARTEGYYKISSKEKVKYLTKARTYVQESVTDSSALDESTTKKRFEVSRDARSDQRRFIAALQQQEGPVSDLLKFNQLKFRKKDLKFCKSSIHGWGLYAMEPIAADEMVIEYVGESVRQSIADTREKNYERMGIGSSYLFRIDALTIIDATKTGNLARFINHSCNPNCYAKIISVESQKKIVIYSKQAINIGDEITYDYKFPIEEEKIPCLCGAAQCRGTLN